MSVCGICDRNWTELTVRDRVLKQNEEQGIKEGQE